VGNTKEENSVEEVASGKTVTLGEDKDVSPAEESPPSEETEEAKEEVSVEESPAEEPILEDVPAETEE